MRSLCTAFVAVVAAFAPGAAPQPAAQGRTGQQSSQPASAKAAAPIDLTGQWVSVVTEDWRWRMVTPPKGDYASIPITPAAKQVADRWDPARDEANGEQCKSYGAAAIMRVPGRLRITWQDDNTLKVETDAGTQTRLLHFDARTVPAVRPTWQGLSVAEWEVPTARGRRGEGAPTDARPKFGNLKVVTTHMRSGYLRKNGVPYSADAILTEYWDVYTARNRDQWLVITTSVIDPSYLQQPWLTTPNFKREPEGSKWDPTPCSTRW